ncbi:hypothetical protein DFH09DRAFT_1159931 [Mycena vulgaris]|nr:hypothetical protein DFH09DRAFT_1159931 [Mycena vulgaris]
MAMVGGTGAARGRPGVICGGYWRGVRCVFFFLLFSFAFCSSVLLPFRSSYRPFDCIPPRARSRLSFLPFFLLPSGRGAVLSVFCGATAPFSKEPPEPASRPVFLFPELPTSTVVDWDMASAPTRRTPSSCLVSRPAPFRPLLHLSCASSLFGPPAPVSVPSVSLPLSICPAPSCPAPSSLLRAILRDPFSHFHLAPPSIPSERAKAGAGRVCRGWLWARGSRMVSEEDVSVPRPTRGKTSDGRARAAGRRPRSPSSSSSFASSPFPPLRAPASLLLLFCSSHFFSD